MGEFKDKIAFVTGATSGIGRATAIAFAHEGAMVVGCGRHEEAGDETLDLFKQAGGNGLFVDVDVAVEAQVAGAIETIVSRYGRLDCAANCAGVDSSAALLDYTELDYQTIFDANVKGLFFCIKHEIIAMQKTGGSIVNVSSIAGQKVIMGNSLYCASKSASSMLTKCAALESGKLGIRVNEVSPGPINTPMLQSFLDHAKATGSSFTAQSLSNSLPLHHIGAPEDVAAAILFLCSGRARFTTGASLSVDGGLLFI